MLPTYSAQQSIFYEDPGEKFDPSYLIDIFKRKIFFFVIPFLVIGMLGFAIVEIQRPIYRSEGRILVKSPEIPPDLVRPTITEVAEQRVEVIQQRIMARDNLLAVANKYNLFPRERSSMSETELIDLIRSRTEIKPIEPDVELLKRQEAPAIAFTLSFDYEVPDLAMKVANELLTSILSEDASTRTKNAEETTQFLEREVKRLESEHDSIIGQLVAVQQQVPEQPLQRPLDREHPESNEVITQKKNLSDLEATLVQKSSIYSDEHPVVKNLKRSIAELKRLIASEPATPPTTDAAGAAPANDRAGMPPPTDKAKTVDALVLERQELNLEKDLEEANRKLTTARLGESMERGQQGEHLQVIEPPSLPQTPVRPLKLKWITMTFALAGVIATGSVILAETFDDSIRGSRELAKIIDRNLIVTIPYLSESSEENRKRLKLILLCVAIVGVVALAIAVAGIAGISIDFVGFNRLGNNALTRLLH